MRILAILGTRPEIIKLVPVILALRNCAGVEVRLCHTGQHQALGLDLLAATGIECDHMLSRETGILLADLFPRLIAETGAVLNTDHPDLVIVQGDTATAAAGALSAFNRSIPIAHVEAGLRSGDLALPWPEEGYRRIISPLARWHFAPTAGAADNLRRENIDPAAIHQTGNTVIDALHLAREMLRSKPALGSEADTVLAALGGAPFALATIHRREQDSDDLRNIGAALCDLAQDIAIVLPAHPRPESRVLIDVVKDHPAIHVVAPFDYFAFIRLLDAARLVLTDSGGIQEEGTALGKPVLVLRSVTERAEAVTAGAAQLVGNDMTAMLQAARQHLADNTDPIPADVFGDGKAAQRIARILNASV
ncbi:UDP-N-acetylglucosamine 2-epimerase (non-hydrolyzing) [Croceicoccus sp. F390]|uniref:UDP-N-acetylglucosamine 2-epimerase (non-hydrolyzing) n=1 Tax=Croceicoccus esteveae TaxID=3075597 RepID=A0ABU2ZHY1_9SPHN|nr:UDP-N-acetylglucosamine 2-epimerase (non-hydrolyzing) [Croceicoccus sp. F390]MDT0576221.1 UDP-N-acetylglucosamine 2-epimerase (non-hydrolyzing) [Croceicoccus sp. F390]